MYVYADTKVLLALLCTIAIGFYVCNWALLTKERAVRGNGIYEMLIYRVGQKPDQF